MRPIFHDDKLQATFERAGYVIVDLLNATDVAELAALHDSREMDGRDAPYTFTAASRDIEYRRQMCEGIKAILRPRLNQFLDRCRPLMGNFFCKPPNNDISQIEMHQDWSFVNESKHHSLSAWCPLTDATEENGGLAVVPGSHKLNNRPRGLVYAFPYAEFEPLLAEKYSKHLTVMAGQAVMFYQSLFHWSKPNRSQERRLAAACSVAPEESRVVFPHPDDERHPGKVELFEVEGEDFFSRFMLGERPEGIPSLGLIDSRPATLSEEILERELGHLVVHS